MKDPSIRYEPLPIAFTKKHLTYTQIERVKDVAIYRVEDDNWETPIFEVIRIRSQKARTATFKVDGVAREQHFRAYESYPSSETWGVAGWTHPSLFGAQARLLNMTTRQEPTKEVSPIGKIRGEKKKTTLGIGRGIKTPPRKTVTPQAAS